MPRPGSKLFSLVKRLEEELRRPPQRLQHADQIKREIAELLPEVFYVRESRFKPAEERVEALGEVEEVVAEEGLEPVEEAEEAVEDDEYLSQHIVRRVFPGERPRVRPPPVRRCCFSFAGVKSF
jgi:hypothetical protein